MPGPSATQCNRLTMVLSIVVGLSGLILASMAQAKADDKKPPQILFKNVNIFDSFSDKLENNMSVLVEANQIKAVGKSIVAPNATVVDGGGRTMTPGLIDMHQHVMLNAPEGTASYQTKWDDAAGGAFAHYNMVHNMLLKGITTIRDIVGDPLDIAKGIDMGLLPGPRVYAAGGAISQTGGHGD